MQKITVIVGMSATSLFVSVSGYANSYDRGIKLYRHADFKGAERAFLEVLRGGANRATKGRVYKYIGLSQYMAGRKIEARASFHSALKYDPKTEIYPDEALDSSVLEFFLQIKQDRQKGIVLTTPPSANKKYPPRGKSTPSRRITPKTVTRTTPRRTTAAKIAPRAVAKKHLRRKARSTAPIRGGKRSTKNTQQTAGKKARGDSLFKGKTKKPPRVIFRGKSDSRQWQSTHLLPPGSNRSGSYPRGKSGLWHFMPFGAGQYMNDNYKLGHAFAAAGILTLGSFVYHTFRWQTDQGTLVELKDDRARDSREFEANQAHGDPCVHTREAFDNCWNLIISEWEDYLGALKLYSYLSLAGFVTVWVGGVVEAMVGRPAAHSYSLLVPKVHYEYDYQGHQLALRWQYQLP